MTFHRHNYNHNIIIFAKFGCYETCSEILKFLHRSLHPLLGLPIVFFLMMYVIMSLAFCPRAALNLAVFTLFCQLCLQFAVSYPKGFDEFRGGGGGGVRHCKLSGRFSSDL
jgi:hypothetical protein